jgi:hypothetical protein
VNADGYADIICGAGPGGGPNITIFSGKDNFQTQLFSFFAFPITMTLGIYVGGGDLDGDGHADIMVGPSAGGGSNVALFSGVDVSPQATFQPYGANFAGAIRVAGAMRGAGEVDTITVPGPGTGPDVKVWKSLKFPAQINEFFPFDVNFTGGLYIAGNVS